MFEPEKDPTTSHNSDATLKSISENYAVNPAGGVIDMRDGEQVASVADLFPEDPTPSAPASAKIPHSEEALSLFGEVILGPTEPKGSVENPFLADDVADAVTQIEETWKAPTEEVGVHTPEPPAVEADREEMCHSVSPKGNKCSFVAGHPGKHEIFHMLGEEVWSSDEVVAADLKEIEEILARREAEKSGISSEWPFCRNCDKQFDPSHESLKVAKEYLGYCSLVCSTQGLPQRDDARERALMAPLPIDAATTLDGMGTDPDALAIAMIEQAPMTKGELFADLIAGIPKMDDDSLATVGSEVEMTIADIKVRHESELADHVKTRAVVYAEIEKRVLANLGEDQIRAQTGKSVFRLPVRDVEAGVEIKRDTAKFVDVLRGLKDFVSDEEFDAAVYQEKLPKPEDVPWTANMTKLKALVKKYGEKSQVGEIVRKGTVYRESSRRVFLRPLKQEPRNVTPITGEAA